jgi:PAS domain S-box-containing protein
MVAHFKDPNKEIQRLERCLNDTVSVMAFPAVWTGRTFSQTAQYLLDALLRLLQLDLAYARLKDGVGKPPIEIVRVPESQESMPPPDAICKLFGRWFGDEPQTLSAPVRKPIGERTLSLLPWRLGLQGEFGSVIVASQRTDFPNESEKLLLSLAANQGAIGLQEARLRGELAALAAELDDRVAQRTAELAEANQALREEIARRQRAEEALQAREFNLRLIVNSIPAPVAVMTPDGQVQSVNQPTLQYFGKTLEDLKRWGTSDAVHPDDLAHVIDVWMEAIKTGQAYEVNQRLRRFDGVYRWFEVRGFPLKDPDGLILNWCVLLTDIEDRQRAEEALRASERNLSLNINAMPTLLASARPDGWGDFFNQRWLDYTGLSAAQLDGWGWASPIHPDDIQGLLTIWRSSLVSGSPLEAEARMRRFDGVYRWLLFRANALRDESGNIVRWYGNVVDIDDRKRAEQALRASELSWRDIVDSIPGLVATLDEAGEVGFINRQVMEYFGRPSGELKSWALMDCVHPDDLPRLIESRTNAIKAGEVYESVHRLRRADGAYRWFQVRGLPVRDTKGPPNGWYLLLIDIDDRKQAEEKLRRSEALLAESQRLSLTGSFLWRAGNDEITWSKQLYRIFEFDQTAPINLGRISERIHPDDLGACRTQIERSREYGSDVQLEFRLQLPDRSVRHIHVVAHANRDENGQLEYTGAVQDVTQRRFSEEALAKARTELAHMTRVTSLGVLTASIAHEVNQPLFGIITSADTCLLMLSTDPPDIDGARETARRTIRDGNRAADVIKRLRALYGKKDPSLELMDLNEATREVISLSMSDLQRHRVILQQELSDDLPFITADRVQLQQVIMNLVRNASDAMSNVDDRQRDLLVRTENDKGNGVRLSVKDSGVGFESHAADKLFDAFYTTKREGMGIGLSISRSIIEAHGGHLWATTNDGAGATFSFSIPYGAASVAHSENHVGVTR